MRDHLTRAQPQSRLRRYTWIFNQQSCTVGSGNWPRQAACSFKRGVSMDSEVFKLTDRTTIGAGEPYGRSKVDITLIQLSVFGTGAVSATTQVFGSNDEIAWVDLGSITATGTNSGTVSDSIDVPFRMLRADITAISGTGARALVTQNGSA